MKIDNVFNTAFAYLLTSILPCYIIPKFFLLHAEVISNSASSKIKNVAKEITVQIILPGENNGGSGVLVRRSLENNKAHYFVLTNAHVIGLRPGLKCGQNGKSNIKIKTFDGKIYEALIHESSEYLCKSNDLSLLEFSGEPTFQYTIAKIGKSENTPEKENVYISGFYCNPRCENAILDIEKGPITKLESPRKSGYQIGYKINSSRVGKSGGAVLNMNSELIGIHGKGTPNFSGRSSEDEYQIYGLREGTPNEKTVINSHSWAIPSSRFTTIFSFGNNNLSNNKDDSNKEDLSSPKIIEGANINVNNLSRLEWISLGIAIICLLILLTNLSTLVLFIIAGIRLTKLRENYSLSKKPSQNSLPPSSNKKDKHHVEK
jgi:Trypsin-like peptidase domain